MSLALAIAALDASALGFASIPTSAVLGQSLDQSIVLRLEPDEVLTPECVSADVMVGDQRVSPASVAARIESAGNGQATLRVVTATVVDEPVVSISVSLGCPPKLSRRFVVFADPPSGSAPSVPLVLPAEPVRAAVAERPAPVAAPVEPRPAPAAASAPPRPRAVERSAAAAPAPRRRAAPPAPRASEAVAAVAAAAARPRLQLDAVDPAELRQARADAAEVAASAASAVAQARQAAQAIADAASASERRVAELERAIEKMRSDAAADRESMRVLRQRAAQSDASSALPYLVALVVALAALAAWLGLRLRRVQTDKQLAWWNASEVTAEARASNATEGVPTGTDTASLAPTTAGPSTTRPGALSPVFPPEPMPSSLSSAPDTEPPSTGMERTQALPVGWRPEREEPRDVSVEELIDLEQQAEFFSVLGQEDAAIDLLVDYLRSTGGASPMPYLKLLEIYRRRGDREAYDRTRARFNHRFNAYAPDWDDDPAEGRSLEDYPAIVARLQMAWPSPIDAMAELESLLFRKSRGELFELPAYRDVLFLYSLARDLLDREPLETGTVDVLLPISDGTEFTQPMSLEDSPASASSMVPLDNPPTVPVDLDVTQPQMPESLFGENATLPLSSGQVRQRF
ncbi:MAG: hypothetical protein U1F56_24555 [Rubrivivax sp.]